MFKISKKEDNVKMFSVIDDTLIYLKGEVFFCGKEQYKIKPMWFKSDITKKNIWLKDINWEDFKIDLESKIVSKLNYKIGLNGTIEDCILIFKDSKSICYDIIQNKEIEISLDNEQYYIKNGNNLYCQIKSNTLKSLSLQAGEYEWEVDLGGRYYLSANEQREAQISKIIDVIENNLYVWMDTDRLVKIETTTGKILSEIFPLQILKDNGTLNYVLQPQYRESEQSIFFFYQDFLVKIHLPTLTTSLLWQDNQYNIGQSFITDNYIYFIGSNEKGALFRDSIGVFDRQKNEVVWMQQVIELSKETYNNLKEIQATDDKIYVLDTEGTLYIFEKEKIA